jgi:hypothetical protein
MNAVKPISTFIKAVIACATLIVFGLGFSWGTPFVQVSCVRTGKRVECQVQRQLIGLITCKTTTIRDLKAASFHVEEGTTSSTGLKTTDTGYLRLVDAERVEKEFILESGNEMDMTRSKSFVNGIESFLRTDEPTFSNWTVPLMGYGAIVPVAVGCLFLWLVTWNFVETRWKALRATDANIDSSGSLK